MLWSDIIYLLLACLTTIQAWTIVTMSKLSPQFQLLS